MTDTAKARARLMIDVSPELRRRIKMAAIARDASVREYIVSLLELMVPAEPRPEGERGRLVTSEVVEQLDRTRSAVMRGRTFADDSTALIEAARTARSAEL